MRFPSRTSIEPKRTLGGMLKRDIQPAVCTEELRPISGRTTGGPCSKCQLGLCWLCRLRQLAKLRAHKASSRWQRGRGNTPNRVALPAGPGRATDDYGLGKQAARGRSGGAHGLRQRRPGSGDKATAWQRRQSHYGRHSSVEWFRTWCGRAIPPKLLHAVKCETHAVAPQKKTSRLAAGPRGTCMKSPCTTALF
jgi:hypothetical protein